MMARLPIPVFRNLFFGCKETLLPGFLRISFFSCVFWRNISQERGFGEVAGIPFFFDPGFLQIPPDFCSRQKLYGLGQQLKKALC